ncbi:hypothetical protein QS361_20800, partial [Escherichia coli]|nr:hypothetical protein [Escherichia coli]
FRQSCNSILRCPSISDGRLSYQFSSDGYIRRSVYAYPVPPSAESHLNGFNTDQMLKQLGNLNPQQFMSGSQGGGNDGK